MLHTGSSAVLLITIMFLGSLVMWIGVPLGWLYVGSQVQAATGSVGAALGVMMVGVIASVTAIASVLGWLSRKHVELQEARGLQSSGHAALEAVLVISATLAVICFAAWFLLFAGTSPFPLLESGF